MEDPPSIFPPQWAGYTRRKIPGSGSPASRDEPLIGRELLGGGRLCGAGRAVELDFFDLLQWRQIDRLIDQWAG